jgi:hypothetical protein
MPVLSSRALTSHSKIEERNSMGETRKISIYKKRNNPDLKIFN